MVQIVIDVSIIVVNIAIIVIILKGWRKEK